MGEAKRVIDALGSSQMETKARSSWGSWGPWSFECSQDGSASIAIVAGKL